MLDVSVLGSSQAGELADLSSEVLRTKAALIYADEVHVVSPKVPLLSGHLLRKFGDMAVLTQLGAEGSTEDQFLDEVLEGVRRRAAAGPPSTSGHIERLINERPEVLKALLANREGIYDEILAQMASKVDPVAAGRAFAASANVIVENFVRNNPEHDSPDARKAAAEVVELERAEMVHFETFASERILGHLGDDAFNVWEQSLVEAILYVLSHGLRRQPMFSDGGTEMLRSMRERGELDGVDMRGANRAAVAAHLITSVPTFPHASIDELLDVRGRVRPHVASFRAAVADLAETTDGDLDETAFEEALIDAKVRLVDPAVAELRQALDDGGVIQTLSRGVPTVAASAIGFAVALAAKAPDVAGAVALAAGLSTAAATEIVRRDEGERKAGGNQFFLLFDLERHLGRA